MDSALVPGPSYSITMRIDAPSSPSLLPDLSRTVNTVGAVAVDLVEVGPAGATVDVTFHARDQAHVSEVTAGGGPNLIGHRRAARDGLEPHRQGQQRGDRD
jgi:hypothetical protein